MNTLICAGGSSQRVLTSILHLCAAGLGPEKLRILVVDPDAANGNGNETARLVNAYIDCHHRFAGKLGPGLNLFGTKLDLLLDVDATTPALQVWTPVHAPNTLADIINYDNLSSSDTPQDVARLLFTAEEIRMDLDKGFKGRTAVGAAAMSLVSQKAAEHPWKKLIELIRNDVAQGGGSHVMVVGSVFGGTGASAIHPLVRFLRSVPQTNHQKLKIAATALVPYFTFASTATGGALPSPLAAQARWFPLRTKSAVEFYSVLQKDKDFDFNALFWIGDHSPMDVQYADGGPSQRNPAHYVDFVAALAALEYFRDPEGLAGNYYAGTNPKVHPEVGDLNAVDWGELPLRRYTPDELRTGMLRFFLAGAMHVGFFSSLLDSERINTDPYCVPWYYKRFARKNDHLDTHAHKQDLAKLSSFFVDYHLPWWSETTNRPNVFLFNHSAFQWDRTGSAAVHLDRLANLQGIDRPADRATDSIDTFVEKMDEVPAKTGGAKGVPAYFSLLAHASDLYIQDVYKMRIPSRTEARS